jgi:hypothetical protein
VLVVLTGRQPKEQQMTAARKTKTPARKTTTARKPAAAKAATKKPPGFEAKTGDAKLVEAAKAASVAWRTAVKNRDKAIVAAVKGGASARQVALACDLSHPAVLKITKR